MGLSPLTLAGSCLPRWPRGCPSLTCRDSIGWKSTATIGRRRLCRFAATCLREIEPAVVADLDAFPPPSRPVVPFVECVQDRIAIEIMRGCPGKCRFCQSTTIKRPLRFRKVETIVQAALDQYRNTGYNEISLLSLSTSDYPHFDELMRRLQETFRPLGVGISLPSLRINEQLLTVGDLMNTDRHSGLTLAPEAALDDMRRRIGKPITNEDLYAGCRRAFENGFSRVKLYFMCGLPGEREADLAGIIEMSETIARLGQEIRGRPVTVVANVSNFVPKPQTPFQWNADAAPRVFPQRPRVPASAKAAAERATEVPRHRNEPVGGRDVSRRPPAWARRSSWHGAAAPASTAGPSSFGRSYGGKRWPTPGSTSKKCFTSPAPPTPPCPGIISAFGKGEDIWSGNGAWRQNVCPRRRRVGRRVVRSTAISREAQDDGQRGGRMPIPTATMPRFCFSLGIDAGEHSRPQDRLAHFLMDLDTSCSPWARRAGGAFAGTEKGGRIRLGAELVWLCLLSWLPETLEHRVTESQATAAIVCSYVRPSSIAFGFGRCSVESGDYAGRCIAATTWQFARGV